MIDADGLAPQSGATADMRGSVHQLARAVEHLRDGCIFVDFAMRVEFMNAAARRDCAARGQDPADYPGNDLWSLLNYAPASSARQTVERAVRARAATYFTTRGTFGDF